METIDIIRQLCAKKGISVAQLESELEYGNGSIAKSKNMSADRMYKIAQYFGVSVEYLLTGKTVNETNDEMAILRQQQSILMQIGKIGQDMTEYYKRISECQDQLADLKKEYSKLESQKKPLATDSQDAVTQPDIFDMFGGFEDKLPFNKKEG